MSCIHNQGVKWLANLWVWNGPRHENWVDEHGTINGSVGKLRPTRYHSVSVTFENLDVQNAHLYWEDTVSVKKCVIILNTFTNCACRTGENFKLVREFL